jgi:hypothetical protein
MMINALITCKWAISLESWSDLVLIPRSGVGLLVFNTACFVKENCSLFAGRYDVGWGCGPCSGT